MTKESMQAERDRRETLAGLWLDHWEQTEAVRQKIPGHIWDMYLKPLLGPKFE